MAKNFGSAGSNKTIQAVAQASNEKANVITVKMISSENLFDYKNNNEDIKDTADLENSMKELGFTDPIEVTDFGMEDGKFTIVSGHRRKYAGLNVGISVFPCIIKHFNNEKDVNNYVLLSNSQRDSAKDPLLFCKRYKMHEEYLKLNGFKESMREEIAKRLGISIQQADRYNQFNKIILPVWDMVRDETVGMSSVLPMASHTESEQVEIYNMFLDALENKQTLTRDLCKRLIKAYRDGKKSYIEAIQLELEDVQKVLNDTQESSQSAGAGISIINVNSEPTETADREHSPLDRNNEINYDYSHREGLESGYDPYASERLNDDDKKVIEFSNKNDEKQKEEKPQLTEDEKRLQAGEKISQSLSRIEGLLNDFYKFEDNDKAEAVMITMGSVIKLLVAEMENISESYKKSKSFDIAIKDVLKDINTYIK